MAAEYNEDPAVAAALLEAGADLHARGYEGETPLHRGGGQRQSRGRRPAAGGRRRRERARGSTGWTVLHDVVGNSNPEVLAVLVDAGAELEAVAEFPDSHWAYGSRTPPAGSGRG